MNDERLFERLAAHAGPPAIDDAFEDRLYSILQREMRRGLWSRPLTSRAILRIGFVTVTLVALAVVGITLFGPGNVGDGPGASQTPEPTLLPTPAATPFFLNFRLGPMDPGPHYMLGPSSGVASAGWPERVSVTVPEGWVQVSRDRGSGIYKGLEGTGPGFSQARLDFWSVGTVAGDPCGEESVSDSPLGPTVEDLSLALASIPGVQTTRMAATTLDGFAGVTMELTVPAQAPCDFYRLWDSPPDSRGEVWGFSSAPGWIHRLWILDVDGLRVIVDTSHPLGASAEMLAELDQMVDSIDIERNRPTP